MTCGAFTFGISLGFGAAFGAIILAAERPPPGFVEPSRAKIFSAAFLRAGSRLAIAAFSAFTVPDFVQAACVFIGWHLLTLLSWFGCLGAFFESLSGGGALSAGFTHFFARASSNAGFLGVDVGI
jgi:hypothetical protein